MAQHRFFRSSLANAAWLLGILLLLQRNVAAFRPLATPSNSLQQQRIRRPRTQRLIEESASLSQISYQQPSSFSSSLHRHQAVALNMLPHYPSSGGEIEALSSFLTCAIPTFDGNTIVDPVVVSDAFWQGLTRQFVSLIIGQFLAATVFGLITTFAASQMSKLGSFVTENIFGQVLKDQKGKTVNGLAQPPPGYTGPPLKVAPDFPKLLLCITIDLIGTSSELIPFVGELTDIFWAPVGAWLLRSLYGGSNIIFALEFAEEILPFTDILPLATICWTVDTFFRDSNIAKVLQLGIYQQGQPTEDVISSDTVKSDNYGYGDKFIRGGKFIDVEPEKTDRRK